MRTTEVLDVLDKLYASAVDAAAWPDFLVAARELFGGTSAGVSIQYGGSAPRYEQRWIGLDPAFEDLYLRHYWRADPWRARAHRLPSRLCAVGSELVPDDELVRGEYYNEVGLRYDTTQVIFALLRGDRGVSSFSVMRGRSRGDFDEADRAVMRRLEPHLRRAAVISAQLSDGARWRMTADDIALGVLHVDAAGRIVAANSLAERLLRERDGITVSSGALCAAHAEDARSLCQAFLDALHPLSGRAHPVALRRASGARALVAHVVSMPASASPFGLGQRWLLVVIADPTRAVSSPSCMLQRLFGLTPAEARLLQALATGLAPKEAAAQFDVSYQTVRSQLRSLFDKCGVRRQAELVKLVLTISSATAEPRLR